MAATGYILPASGALTVLIGADFTSTIIVYTDDTQTVPFDLTGFTIALDIAGFMTLTPGAEMTVNAAAGRLDLALSNTQTAGATIGNKHFTLKLTDGAGFVSYPLTGTATFVEP